ncbi:alpha/beta hydrolase [Actinoplanes sp. DH11]|uniref:alpha/beta hydrolase n=1 Tax=Actinoplanes sp. DH11 TaxID=2857011 RepID=UPI001E608DEF|nr:alpha/beta hydrolase [Actinoplanes sp. DH11]
MTVHVLVHSPAAGPATWAPVAERLDRSSTPSLRGIGDAGPPFAPEARDGPTAVATPERLAFLRGLATAGRLPPWTTWFDESEVAPMFPDARTRQAVTGEEPELPLSYYEQVVAVPPGWDDGIRLGYLLFGAPYDRVAEDARERGWQVSHLPGRHLHQLVDPDAVAREIARLAG